MKKRISPHIEKLITWLILFVFFAVATAGFIFQKNDQNDLLEVEIVRVLDIENDGGFFYQHTEAKLKDETPINLKIRIKDLQLEKVKTGDKVYVHKADTNGVQIYNFAGFKRGQSILWVFMIFVGLVIVMLGKVGIKYMLASIMLFLLIISGAFQFLMLQYNIYFVSLALVAILSFITLLVKVNNLKLAFIVSLAQMLTLTVILLLNLVMFKITFLTEIYYTDVNIISSEVSLMEVWSIINAAVIFISFGASINTALDVVTSVEEKNKKHPSISVVNLIREGAMQTQIASARVINSMFFVFLGVSLTFILLSQRYQIIYFWDDSRSVQFILLFINASIAALFIGPMTALISAILIGSQNKKAQISIQDS